MEYTTSVWQRWAPNGPWMWEVRPHNGFLAPDEWVNGKSPDEPIARKCAQAVIDALSPQPTTPTDAELFSAGPVLDMLKRAKREARAEGRAEMAAEVRKAAEVREGTVGMVVGCLLCKADILEYGHRPRCLLSVDSTAAIADGGT